MRYSCGCDTGIRITETMQILKLETIGVHDQHSHIGGKMHARKSRRMLFDVALRLFDDAFGERAERAQDSEYVNGEKLFMSLSSAECTEVEYATERYSQSPPPRQGRSCAAEEGQRLCSAHTSGARFFQRRSPYFL